ncbi:MAG TPA: hypothetical protein VFG30_04830 [Polyangiales bacterium]|nr:hypothetical protein [Polyangiales bacterium]
MAELTQWLRSEARRQAARPDLLAALLAGGSFAYARYRLGFMALRMLLRTGIHAIEIQLLIAAFVPWEYFVPLLAYRAVCSLLGAAHWGALETLRERVRDAVRRRRPDEARGAIARAFGLTLWAAAGLIVVVFGTEVASTLASGLIELRATYALACVLRLGSDSALRALHSGVFAVRRVHRPLWSTLVPDLVELAVISFGFGELGLWSIPVAILAGGALDAVLAFVFVRRAYLQRRLQLPRVWQSLSVARQVRAHAGEAGSGARHALASVTLQLDGVLLLILAQAGQSAPGAASFAALYYVLRPLMAASTHWVRTFYFDLKLVDSGAFRAFRPQLLRFLERLAVSWAFVLALVTLVLARFVFGEHASWSLLVLVPFFVARSAFALLQVVAFGAGDLKRLLQTGLAVIAGVFVLRATGLAGWVCSPRSPPFSRSRSERRDGGRVRSRTRPLEQGYSTTAVGWHRCAAPRSRSSRCCKSTPVRRASVRSCVAYACRIQTCRSRAGDVGTCFWQRRAMICRPRVHSCSHAVAPCRAFGFQSTRPRSRCSRKLAGRARCRTDGASSRVARLRPGTSRRSRASSGRDSPAVKFVICIEGAG